MFISKDTKEFKWYWLDKKMHTVSIELDGEKIDIEELYKTATELLKEKEDACKNIYFLGLAMTGSMESAWGFLLGWLVRSIKKDKNWQVQHIEEDIPVEEVNAHIAETFRKYADMIEKGELNTKEVGTSTPNIGGSDGTEFFKS